MALICSLSVVSFSRSTSPAILCAVCEACFDWLSRFFAAVCAILLDLSCLNFSKYASAFCVSSFFFAACSASLHHPIQQHQRELKRGLNNNKQEEDGRKEEANLAWTALACFALNAV